MGFTHALCLPIMMSIMTKTTTLLLMAATLVPLPLRAAPAPTAAQRFEALAAPQQPCCADSQRRMAQFAVASLLPADIEMALVLPHVKEHMKDYCPAGALLAAPVDSIALGLADGSAKSIAALRAFKTLMMLPGAAEDAAMEWRKDARNSLSDLITQAASRLGQESRSQAGGELAQVVIHPIYLIASPDKGAGDALKALTTLYTDALVLQSGNMPGAEAVETGGMKGVKISGKVLSELIAVEEAHEDEKPSDESLYLQAELSKRTFYLLAGMRGDKAVLVLCEDPEEIRWAANAEQSVLATEAWKAADTCPADGNISLIATMSPALYASTQCACDPSIGVLSHLGELFKVMADRESADAAVFQAAATGLNTLASNARALRVNVTKAATALVWETPGHVHLSLRSDALGLSYKPGQLRLTSMADVPNNVLYLESTEMLWARKPNVDQIIQAAAAALEGGLATLRPEKRSEISHYMQQLKLYRPELQEARQALLALREGLCNTDAFVVDASEQTLPLMGDKKQYLPCFAYYSGVCKRTMLSAGWDGLTVAAGKALAKAGSSPLLLGALPVATSSLGNATSYSLAMPFLTPELGGNVTVSDSAFAIGTSSRLNAQIVQSATGHLDFAGAAFCVNFVELAKVSRSMAEIADRQEELLGDDIDDDAETAADMAEAAASMFERVSGTSTVKDGIHTLHLDMQKR